MTRAGTSLEQRGLLRRVGGRADATGRPFFGQLLSDVVDSTEVLAALRRFARRGRGYSQFGEDKVISILLPEGTGRYWDLGAGHPVEHSNTYLLYRRGFRGLAVEPICELAKKWRRTRRRDHVVQGLVSADAKSVTSQFWEFERWALSTCDESRARFLVDSGEQLRRSYEVVATPVMQLLDGGVDPSEPSLLSMDLEGVDLMVLRKVDFSTFRPRVIAIEDHQKGDGNSEISVLLSSHGYRLVSQHWVTSIWLAEDWREDTGFSVPGTS